MKLAEALINRADLQRRMNALEIRLSNNARVQEGEVPAEDPMLLLSELMEVTQQLEDLVTRINLTNSQTIDGDDTLTGLLAQRDIRGQELRILNGFLNNASDLAHRSSRSEIRVISTVDVSELRKQSNALSAELRALDVRIQSLNWTTDLLDK